MLTLIKSALQQRPRYFSTVFRKRGTIARSLQILWRQLRGPRFVAKVHRRNGLTLQYPIEHFIRFQFDVNTIITLLILDIKLITKLMNPYKTVILYNESNLLQSS